MTLLQDTCENHRLALPNKLFEYIAAGVPVMASALPETRALVEATASGGVSPPMIRRRSPRGCAWRCQRRHDQELAERLRIGARELCWEVERERLIGVCYRAAGSARGRAGRA